MTKLTKEKVKKAILGTGGVITSIANKCGVARISLYKFLEKHQEFKELLKQEREKIIDVAENRLFKANEEGQKWAVEKILSTLGKDRGYVEKTITDMNLQGELTNVNVDLSKIELCKDYNEQSGNSTKGNKQSNKK